MYGTDSTGWRAAAASAHPSSTRTESLAVWHELDGAFARLPQHGDSMAAGPCTCSKNTTTGGLSPTPAPS